MYREKDTFTRASVTLLNLSEESVYYIFKFFGMFSKITFKIESWDKVRLDRRSQGW